MIHVPPAPLEPEDWRGRAEARLDPGEAQGLDLREGESQRLVHELRVHQI